MKSGVIEGSLYVGAGLLISGILGFIYYILMAQYLNPEDFGLFSVFFFSIMITGRFLSYGIKIKIARTISSRKKANEVVGAAFASVLIITVFFVIITFIFKNSIAIYLFNNSLDITMFFIFGVLSFIPFMVVEGILQGKRYLKLIGIQKVLGDILKIFSFGFVFYFRPDINGVLVSVIGFVLFFSIFSLGFILSDLKNIKISKSLILEFIKDSILISLIQGCVMFVFFGPPIIVKILSDSYSLAGMFAATFTFLKTPVVLYEGLLISLLPNVSKAVALKDNFRLKRYIKHCRVFTLFLSLLLIAGAYMFGGTGVGILYGKEYVLYRVHIMLIAFIIAIHLFASLYSEILVGMNRIKQATFSWVAPIIFFILTVLFLPVDVIYRIEVGFILYNLLVVILLGFYLKHK